MRRNGYIDGDLDGIDGTILQTLSQEGRVALKELAARVNLSAPSVAERVRRLEEKGAIQGYHAHVDPAAIGLPLIVYIRARPHPGQVQRAAECLAQFPEIMLCERVTGDDCFIARAAVSSVAHLEQLIDQLLPFAVTHTSVVQSAPVQWRMPGKPKG